MAPYGLAYLHYWNNKTADTTLQTDFLLPNGICVTLEIPADTSLANLKSMLWKKAKDYPRFEKLAAENEYVFSCVSRMGEMEELVDEERSLFDVKPFKPYLKVVKKQGDEFEKLQESKISMLIGTSLQGFKQMNVEEVDDFRMKYRNFCESIAQQRGRATWIRRAIYTYPPEFAETQEIPPYIQEKLVDCRLAINVVLVKTPGTINKTFMVRYNAYPNDLIRTALEKKRATLKSELEKEEDYIIKIVGKESYLLGSTFEEDGEEKYFEYPLIQYKYIRDCISKDERPFLCLVPKCELQVEDRSRTFSLVDNPPPLPPKGDKNSISLWDLSPDTMFRIKIVCAANVHARDMKKSVKCGLYHGSELLCDVQCTEACCDTRWNHFLNFNIPVINLPRMARLCFSVFGYNKKDKNKRGVPLLWVNTTVFDYKGFLKTGPLTLYCWRCDDKWFESNDLKPIGTVVSNSSVDNWPCILVEFSKYAEPVKFPPFDKVLELAAQVTESQTVSPLTAKGSSRHRAEILQIIARDPLAQFSEKDKELLWYLRAECCDDFPRSLPKLLQSIDWKSREDVSQMEFLLTIWRKDLLSPEDAFELLDYKFADNNVRKFTVELLEEMKDSELELYLIQLVQALKYESYLDCALTKFLLKRALNNRRVGHFLFWNLRSEMHNPEVSVRFGLILEAYCRGSPGHLESLTKQYEAINKLKTLTELLQDSSIKELKEKVNVMKKCFKQDAYKRAFSNFTSPLDPSVQLKDLRVEECGCLGSKKKPLWLVFRNQDTLAEDVLLIFKNGDDLRQDMLTLQMLRIMDTIWKNQGLDLHMTPYRCQTTGRNLGVIEVVKGAQTVAKIQKCQGRFRGIIAVDCLFKSLEKSNDQENLSKAVERFTKSCAGYCMATYVLGIGDRHNDNVMMRPTGEFLHIDFGHFLGNFKKKFGIQREKAPFMLSDSLIYAVNSGNTNRDTAAFESFIDLCARSYEFVRNKGSLVVTLFTIMLGSGIPQLSSTKSLDYLRRSLCLTKNPEEAKKHLDDTVKEALQNKWTTEINFMVHYIKHYKIG